MDRYSYKCKDLKPECRIVKSKLTVLLHNVPYNTTPALPTTPLVGLRS